MINNRVTLKIWSRIVALGLLTSCLWLVGAPEFNSEASTTDCFSACDEERFRCETFCTTCQDPEAFDFRACWQTTVACVDVNICTSDCHEASRQCGVQCFYRSCP